jgi:dienelactone hydrolase
MRIPAICSTRLVYSRMRYFDASTGHRLSHDPMGFRVPGNHDQAGAIRASKGRTRSFVPPSLFVYHSRSGSRRLYEFVPLRMFYLRPEAQSRRDTTMAKLFFSSAVMCALCAGVACGSADGTKPGAATGAGAGTGAGTGAPLTAGVGSTTQPPVGTAGTMATTPPAKPSGAAGMPPSGLAGAGSMSTAGTGVAGASASGSGGKAAVAGAGGAAAQSGTGGTAAPGSGYIRGPDPTMATALGTAKGPYTVKSYTDGFKKGTMYLAGTIYYPDGGNPTPPFGCVIVVPGFTAYQNSIMNWGPFLASNGIVTMTIDTLTTSDQPDQRAGELLDALNDCVNENERAGSPLMGKIDKKTTGLMGWSMGGGGTLIAASRTPTLKAAIGLCAWGPSGGAMNKVPILMFEGTADVLAASMSDGYYMQVPDSVPKMLFETTGADHFYANDPASQMGIVGLYGLSWMKVFLEGDMRYRQFLTGPKPSITTMNFATNVK